MDLILVNRYLVRGIFTMNSQPLQHCRNSHLSFFPWHQKWSVCEWELFPYLTVPLVYTGIGVICHGSRQWLDETNRTRRRIKKEIRLLQGIRTFRGRSKILYLKNSEFLYNLRRKVPCNASIASNDFTPIYSQKSAISSLNFILIYSL